MTRTTAASITIAAGTYMKGTPATVAYAGAVLGSIGAAAGGKHRYDIVYLDTADGAVKLVAGTPDTPTSGSAFLENVAPQPGDLPAETAIMLAIICVDDTGIVSGDFGDYAVAGVANMICELPFGAHLVSYLSTPSEAQGDIIMRGAANWQRLATSTAGKYLRAAGAGADLVWDNLNVTSFSVASEAQGDLITKGAISWGRLGAGSANYYLMSQGAGADLIYSRLLVGSLYHASEAQGNLITRGASSWGVLAPGTAGYYLKSAGAAADLVWANNAWGVDFEFGDGSAVLAAQAKTSRCGIKACKITEARIRSIDTTGALKTGSVTCSVHVHDYNAAIGVAVDTFALSSASSFEETGLSIAVAADKYVTVVLSGISTVTEIVLSLEFEAT